MCVVAVENGLCQGHNGIPQATKWNKEERKKQKLMDWIGYIEEEKTYILQQNKIIKSRGSQNLAALGAFVFIMFTLVEKHSILNKDSLPRDHPGHRQNRQSPSSPELPALKWNPRLSINPAAFFCRVRQVCVSTSVRDRYTMGVFPGCLLAAI